MLTSGLVNTPLENEGPLELKYDNLSFLSVLPTLNAPGWSPIQKRHSLEFMNLFQLKMLNTMIYKKQPGLQPLRQAGP